MKSFKWALIQYDWCSYETSKSGHRHTHREDHAKTAAHKSRREAAKETNPSDTLTSDFWPPG